MQGLARHSTGKLRPKRLTRCSSRPTNDPLRRPIESAQYASTGYRQRLADHDITVSMSRPGNPYDNAKAESFMKTLKTEEVDGRRFKDIEAARRSIAVFIETVYNAE